MSTDNIDSISLNKFISDSGVCSRREADKLIKAKRVTLNGEIAKSGNRVFEGDDVLLDGKAISKKEAPIYLAFNKPEGITCTGDKKDRDNIIDFINYPKRIFYIGRLDKPSEGLIFLTNDGDIVNKILRAGNRHEKEYVVTVNKPLTKDFIKKMGSGVPILDTVTKHCKVIQENRFTFRIILTQGLNRQIRRMCEYFGYRVAKLTRVRIMHIPLGDLPLGKWRYFTDKEITGLMKLIEDSDNLSQKMKSNQEKSKPKNP